MKYKLEHIGVSVKAPLEMAEWYKQNIGFSITLSGGDDRKSVAFVTLHRHFQNSSLNT